MRRAALPLAVLLVSVLLSGAALASAGEGAQAPEPTPIEVLKIEGPLDRPLLSFLHDRLDAAESDGTIVVLQLDSAGALDQDAVALADRVASMAVPVLTWVGPVPARASGGALLLLHASSLAAVSPGSQTGPLTPIDLADPDEQPADLQARIAGWAEARGHDTTLPYPDEALTAQQALDLGIAQRSTSSVVQLLNEADGTEVQTGSGPWVLHTRVAADEAQAQEGTVSLRFNEPGPIKRVQHAVATPSMIYWLLVLALAAFAFELTQPGFGFAGFSGVFLLALAVYGITVAPPMWLGLGVLLAGHVALVLDVRLRRLGVLSAIGIVLFAVGSWWSWAHVAEGLHISPWLIAGAVVAAILYYGFGLTVAIQAHDRVVHTQRGLIGLIGESRGRLAPDGPVYVKGALWRGRSTGQPIDPGAKVRVRGVDGLILQVEADPEGAAEPDPDVAVP